MVWMLRSKTVSLEQKLDILAFMSTFCFDINVQFFVDLVSISPTFYAQLLHVQIPKA